MERLKRKFQNTRKRKEASVAEVISRQLGKRTCMRGPVMRPYQASAQPSWSSLTMYGLINYLPSLPVGEVVQSVAEHVKWLKSEWTTRPKRPDYTRISMLMDKTLSTRRRMIVTEHSPVSTVLEEYPWLKDEYEVKACSYLLLCQ